MNKKQIKELNNKSKEELIKIIVDLDFKLFNLMKELFQSEEYKGVVLDKSLNDFFAGKIEDEEKFINKQNSKE